MKKLFLALFFLPVFHAAAVPLQYGPQPAVDFDPPPKKIHLGKKASITLVSDGKINFEIVVPSEAGKVAEFAAQEMAEIFKKSVGKPVPVVPSRTKLRKYAIFLGDSAVSRKIGIDVSKIPRDGFIIRTAGNDIFIAGYDDKTADVTARLKNLNWPKRDLDFNRGTLFGAYDFLERFLQARFYLPTELGTVIPEHRTVQVPEIDILDRPDCPIRCTILPFFKSEHWFGTGNPVKESNLCLLRWRAQTFWIPNCHGLSQVGYYRRFPDHPEYFALRKNGTRYLEHPGYLCLSNPGIRNEIFLDAKSALSGEPATVRGARKIDPKYNVEHNFWVWDVYQPGFFNVHLMDGWFRCTCPECSKYYRSTPPGDSELVWGMTAEIANRIKAAGIKGYITQMAYDKYRAVPKIELPDNVLVQVAGPGPWPTGKAGTLERDRKLLKDWKNKIHRRVWLWSYFLSSGSRYEPNAISYAPRTTGHYYKTLASDKTISGVFLENTRCNLFLCSYLDLYISMKILWDNSLDPDAVLDEYLQLMFGAARPELKKFFDEVEQLWIYKIQGNTYDTPLGPMVVKPTENQLWTAIYSPARLKKWKSLFDQAEKKAASDALRLKRVRTFRKSFLEPVEKKSAAFFQKKESMQSLYAAVPEIREPVRIDGNLDEPVWKKTRPLYLSAVGSHYTPFTAMVRLLRDRKNLYISLEYRDPARRQLPSGKRPAQSSGIWDDATFEIFIDPEAKNINLFQFAVNPSGSVYGIRYPDKSKWLDGILHAVDSQPGKWNCEIAIPLKNLPGFHSGSRANFSINRNLPDVKNKTENFFSWSPYLKDSFKDPDAFGRLVFEQPNENLIRDFDFQGTSLRHNFIGKYWTATCQDGGHKMLDTRNFITGGQSFHGASDNPKKSANSHLRIRVNLKPETRYRVSFYLTAELDPSAFVAPYLWVGYNEFIPEKHIRGSKIPWQIFMREIVTPKKIPACYFGVGLWGKGKFNVDHIVLKEIK